MAEAISNNNYINIAASVSQTDGTDPGGTIYQATAYSWGNYNGQEDDFYGDSGYRNTDGFYDTSTQNITGYLAAQWDSTFLSGKYAGYGLIYLTDEKKYLLQGKDCCYGIVADFEDENVNCSGNVGEQYGDNVSFDVQSDSAEFSLALNSKKIQLVNVSKVAMGTNIYKFDTNGNLYLDGYVGE